MKDIDSVEQFIVNELQGFCLLLTLIKFLL
jgi:hypothetical protein